PFSLLMLRPPPTPTLFPYTTLFRSATPAAPRPQPQAISDPRQIATVVMARMNLINTKKDELTIAIKGLTDLTQQLVQAYAGQMRSEEHTSELQSLTNLVCRLLLEKK